MKILLVNSLYHPYRIGGAERSVQQLAESLVERGFEVVVACSSPHQQLIIERVNKIKIYYIGLINSYWPYNHEKYSLLSKSRWHFLDTYNSSMSSLVGELIESEKPRIVHTNNLAGFSVAVWPEVKKRKLPLIHTLRDYYLMCPRSTMFKKDENCQKQCYICKFYSLPKFYLSNTVDCVIGISNFILNKHIDHGYFGNVHEKHVIYNASQIKNQKNFKSCDSSILRLGYIGRLEPTKGIEYLLSTLKKIQANNWELIIAGTGDENYLKRIFNNIGSLNIRYLGFVDSESFFDKIDILIVPSLWNEPLGRVVLEAYSYGIPVICSNKGGTLELVESSKTGFVFDPQNQQQLVDLITLLLNQPKIIADMKVNCSDKAKNFHSTLITNQYIEFYEKII